MPAVHVGGAIFRPLDGAGFRHGPGSPFPSAGRGTGAVVVIRVPVLSDNYAYLVVSGPEATAVDPGEARPVSVFLREHELALVRILVTHHHADHAGGCAALKRETGCAVLGPRDDRMPALDRALGDSDAVKCGSFEFTALCAPGHTRSHLAYSVRAGADSFIFSGDCLFPSGCGRVLEGTHREMQSSLRKLAALSPDAVLLAGHEYTQENLAFALALEPGNREVAGRAERFRALSAEMGTPPASLLSDERVTNPFLRAGDPLLREALGMERAGETEVFGEIRGRKDRFRWFPV